MISVPALPFSDAKHCNRSLKRLRHRCILSELSLTWRAENGPMVFSDRWFLPGWRGVLPYDYLLCQQILVSLEGQYVCSCGELGHAEVYDATQGAFF